MRDELPRWLPVRFLFSESVARVSWIDLRDVVYEQPFFNHAIQEHIRRGGLVRQTSVREFLEIAETFPSAVPSGYIFHVSRCGSTLLANAMKTEQRAIVLSEAEPLYALLNSQHLPAYEFSLPLEVLRNRLLRGFFGIYAACFGLPIVVKGNTVDILRISHRRSFFPDTPFVINIREPIEVLVSNLRGPADWLRSILAPIGKETLFGRSTWETRSMSLGDFSVLGMKRFFEAALRDLDSNCWVVDYDNISVETTHRIANIFGLADFSHRETSLASVFGQYSKGKPGREYKPDQESKRKELPLPIAEQVEVHLRDLYVRLRQGGSFPMNTLTTSSATL